MKGITVTLTKKTVSGTDPFGQPTYTETFENVDDVLVGEPSTDDINNALTLYGKRVSYTLAIPKGDTHTWKDQRVEFFGEKFMCVGFPIEGIEANIPLRWHKKVRVVRYE